jgi:hypothetical protein
MANFREVAKTSRLKGKKKHKDIQLSSGIIKYLFKTKKKNFFSNNKKWKKMKKRK